MACFPRPGLLLSPCASGRTRGAWGHAHTHLLCFLLRPRPSQGVRQGARAGGEPPGLPEAPPAAADRAGAQRVPGVDLQGR